MKKRGNTKVYAFIEGEYRLVHKQKVSARAPGIDLTPPDVSGKSEEFMLLFDSSAVRAMKGRPVRIVGKDGAAIEQDIAVDRCFQIKPVCEEESV
jgi:hypothetical protein